MAEPGDGGDIIIKGGSVELDFDDSQYPVIPGNPKLHTSPARNIKRIVIVDDRDQKIFDSNDTGQNPMKWKVTVHARH
jgi:hypothetical protein